MKQRLRVYRVCVVFLALVAAGLGVIIARMQMTPEKGRVAIVLDDWGNNSSHLALLYRIRIPLTVAVLPNLRYSDLVALEAGRKGYQVILHLPMEAHGNRSSEADTLLCAAEPAVLQAQAARLLDQIPGISGVNNHQGSLATEDHVLMGIVMQGLKDRGLFFLDSMTTSRSVCSDAARAIGVPFAKRDVFLDLPQGKLDDGQVRQYIRMQLEKLCDIALRKGSAIGIGHDRLSTLDVLREVVPFFRKRGIRFVYISELVK